MNPPESNGPFGSIVEVDFPGVTGEPGGGRGYTLDVPGYHSLICTWDAVAGRPEPKNPELLRDGEELELWLWQLQLWRVCYFRWKGEGSPHLMIEVQSLGVGHKVGMTRKQVAPSDLFRETKLPPLPADTDKVLHYDAMEVEAALRSEPGLTMGELRARLGLPGNRAYAAVHFLRFHDRVRRKRGVPGENDKGGRMFFYHLTRRASR